MASPPGSGPAADGTGGGGMAEWLCADGVWQTTGNGGVQSQRL